MFSNASPRQLGVMAAIASPVLWGISPIFFHFLMSYALDEVLAHRAIWAAVFIAGLLVLSGDGHKLFTTIENKKQLAGLFLGACLVTTNWTAFLYAVGKDQIIESAFGYFIYPLIVIALGLALFGEKLDRRGWLALSAATTGVLIKATQLETVPYIALLIGASFAVYAVVRKRINIDAFTGMAIELLMIAPFMVGYLLYVTIFLKAGSASFFLDGSGYGIFMALASGIITSVPLVLFHMGNRFLALSLTGFLFYINPSLQLLVGVLMFNEPFGWVDLLAFGFIWAALLFQFARLPKV
jgi:chloramphenicol-sensitive protein RarD